jgi:hypothetical protein
MPSRFGISRREGVALFDFTHTTMVQINDVVRSTMHDGDGEDRFKNETYHAHANPKWTNLHRVVFGHTAGFELHFHCLCESEHEK